MVNKTQQYYETVIIIIIITIIIHRDGTGVITD